MIHIPRTYQEPMGVPFYWMNEQSGLLREAVMAFLEGRESPGQREWVAEYLRYVLEAPCWRAAAHLQMKARHARSRAEIDALLDDCLEVGIDPL